MMMKKAITLALAVSFCVSVAQGENARGKNTVKGALKAQAASQCTREQLTLKAGDEDAAMGGVRIVNYTFTNKSSTPCTLKGYPALVLLNKAGQPVPGKHTVNKAKMFSDTDPVPPTLVTLEPSKTAMFLIYYNNGGAGYMGKPCPTYPKVRVTAPGTTRGFTLKQELQTCIKVEVSSIRASAPE
jgi:hypothetical protein